MQAEVKNLKEEITKLSQDRSASSTVGNKSRGKSSRWSKSKSSGSASDSEDSSSDSKPSSILKDSKYSGSDKKVQFDKNARPPNPQGTNGFSEDERIKVNALIKEKLATMPKFDEIPNDKNYTIELDGKQVAVFCKKCMRFTKGVLQHTTLEHKGRSRGSSTSKSFMAQASASLSSTPSPAPSPSPVGGSICVPIPAPTSYSFGPVSAPLGRASAFYSSSASSPIDDSDDESVASMDHRLLAALGYPKEQGRQG